MIPEAPHLLPNVPLRSGRPDLSGAETQCPARERDGSRCTANAEMWTYGHICHRHADLLLRGGKVVLVNGTRLNRPWAMPGRFGWWVRRDAA
jgi:hypothetical protein